MHPLLTSTLLLCLSATLAMALDQSPYYATSEGVYNMTMGAPQDLGRGFSYGWASRTRYFTGLNLSSPEGPHGGGYPWEYTVSVHGSSDTYGEPGYWTFLTLTAPWQRMLTPEPWPRAKFCLSVWVSGLVESAHPPKGRNFQNGGAWPFPEDWECGSTFQNAMLDAATDDDGELVCGIPEIPKECEQYFVSPTSVAMSLLDPDSMRTVFHDQRPFFWYRHPPLPDPDSATRREAEAPLIHAANNIWLIGMVVKFDYDVENAESASYTWASYEAINAQDLEAEETSTPTPTPESMGRRAAVFGGGAWVSWMTLGGLLVALGSVFVVLC